MNNIWEEKMSTEAVIEYVKKFLDYVAWEKQIIAITHGVGLISLIHFLLSFLLQENVFA